MSDNRHERAGALERVHRALCEAGYMLQAQHFGDKSFPIRPRFDVYVGNGEVLIMQVWLERLAPKSRSDVAEAIGFDLFAPVTTDPTVDGLIRAIGFRTSSTVGANAAGREDQNN